MMQRHQIAKQEANRAAAEAESNAKEIHALKGKLFLALQCIYLQGDATIVTSIGQYRPSRGAYKDVLSDDDCYGEWVRGYMAQGCVSNPSANVGMSPQQLKTNDHIAAFVTTDWIYAHMFLKPHTSLCSPDFNKAVKLVRRASETMCRVSYMIAEAARSLADKLDIMYILYADPDAEAALVQEEPDNLQASIPRLPFEVKQWFEYPPAVVAHADKPDARIAFEQTVCAVFSYNVCTYADGVMLCTTGLRKRYDDMTAEERVSSGTVVLGNIMKDLQNNDATVPYAIAASLVAARALAYSGRKLEVACRDYEKEMGLF